MQEQSQPRKALGKGLASLIPEKKATPTPPATPAITVAMAGARTQMPIESIAPNPNQPRKLFKDEELAELSRSIATHGVIQPLLVSPLKEGGYEIIAGERRWRAAKQAGLRTVPVVVREVTPQERLELAIIENIQREDLNPIEEAQSYRSLMDQFNYDQEEVAKKVGKSRPAIGNSLRLLSLPPVIREDVEKGRLSAGHARALLALGNLENQLKLREKILDSELNVRELERLVREQAATRSRRMPPPKVATAAPTPQLKKVIDEMILSLGTKIRLKPKANGRGGELVVEYYSTQDLDRIYNVIVKRVD